MCALGVRLWDRSYALPAGKYVTSIPTKAAYSFWWTRKTATVTTFSAMNSAKSTASSAAAVSGMSLSAVLANPEKWFVLASLLSYCYVTHYNVSNLQ